MTDLRVTVVVATYNRAELLRRALATVAAQSVGHWECLVCDDGSTDATHEMVRELASRDARFRLSLGERYGLPAAPRNRGIREARAPWVALLDDDDLWHERKLEAQLDFADRVPCDAVSTRAVSFRDDDASAPADLPAASVAPPGEGGAVRLSYAHVMMQRLPYPSTPANMIRRDALLHAGGFAAAPAYRAVEDYDLWLRLLEAPGFRWWVLGNPPLTAFRELGADSISAWTDRGDPDWARRRWAYLECMSRALSRAPRVLSAGDRREAVRTLRTLAGECARLSAELDWRGASIIARHLAAVYAALQGAPREAASELWHATRLAARASPSRRDPTIAALARRSVRNTAALLVGRAASPFPLGMDAPTAQPPAQRHSPHAVTAVTTGDRTTP